MQGASDFDEMGSKLRIANVTSAFDAIDTMFVGDVFVKNPKKKARKAMDPPLILLTKSKVILNRGSCPLLRWHPRLWLPSMLSAHNSGSRVSPGSTWSLFD